MCPKQTRKQTVPWRKDSTKTMTRSFPKITDEEKEHGARGVVRAPQKHNLCVILGMLRKVHRFKVEICKNMKKKKERAEPKNQRRPPPRATAVPVAVGCCENKKKVGTKGKHYSSAHLKHEHSSENDQQISNNVEEDDDRQRRKNVPCVERGQQIASHSTNKDKESRVEGTSLQVELREAHLFDFVRWLQIES